MSVRGLMISAPVVVTSTSTKFQRELDPQELRTSLLFWDRLDLPIFHPMQIDMAPECEFLESAGILERSVVPEGAKTGLKKPGSCVAGILCS